MTVGRWPRTRLPGHRSTPETTIRRLLLALLIVALLGTVADTAQVDPPPPPLPVGPSFRAFPGEPPPTHPLVPGLAPRIPDPPVPAVTVRVRVPAEAVPEKELTYRLIAENTSSASAHHVVVRVTLPSAAKFVRATPRPEPVEKSPTLAWKLGTLAELEKREIALVVVPSGDKEIAVCARVQFEHGQCVRTRLNKSAPPSPGPASPSPTTASKPVLGFRSLGPSEAILYDIVPYKLEVRNTGRATARNVVVKDVLPAGANLINSKPAEKSQDPTVWELGDLPPGKDVVIEYNVVVKQSGTLTSTATLTATDTEPRETRHAVRVGQPALKVSMSGPTQRLAGRPATYHLTVSNPGNLAATNVRLIDQLAHPKIEDKAIEFVRASDGGQLLRGDAHWNLGTLAPGARRTVSLVLKARIPGEFINVCTVSADRGLSDKVGMKTTFAEARGLGVEVEPDRHPLEVGQVSNLVIRVHNAGPSGDANVAPTVTLPEGLKLLTPLDDKEFKVNGRTIHLPKRAIEAGKGLHVDWQVQAEKPGPAKVAVEVTSDGIGAGKSLKAEETITVVPVTVSSRKTSTW